MPYKLDHLLLDPDAMTLVDTETNQLVSNDEKLIAALTLLASRYPNTVTKDELMAVIWPNQILTEWSLTRFIADARKLLGTRHHIKTVHGRGYRYNFPVEEGSLSELLAREKNTKPDEKVSRPLPTVGRTSFIYSLLAVSLLAGLLVIYWHEPRTKPVTAFLPAQTAKFSHPAWRLGIPAFLSAQTYQSEQIVYPSLVKQHLELFNKPEATRDFLNSFCSTLGCNQLVFLEQTMLSNRVVLRYQLLTQEKLYISPDFSGEYLHQAIELLWKDLQKQSGESSVDLITQADETEIYIEALGYLVDEDLIPAKLLLTVLVLNNPDLVQGKLSLVRLVYETDKAWAENLFRNANVKTDYQKFTASILTTKFKLAESQLGLATEAALNAEYISRNLQSDYFQAIALLNTARLQIENSELALTKIQQAEEILAKSNNRFALAIAKACKVSILDKTGDSTSANQLRFELATFKQSFKLDQLSCEPDKLLLY